MQIRALTVAAASAAVLVIALTTHGSNKPNVQAVVDVSWPNCTAAPASMFVTGIIGVNGGLAFRPNPCLARETGWFNSYALYINTGYPGAARARKFINSPRRCGFYDSRCLAYNYGFNTAKYAINYANLSNAHASQWWLDVETDNSWSDSTAINRQSIAGTLAGIKQTISFATVGVYSYPAQWDIITGKWHNGLPAWSATGSLSATVAAKACHARSFTGGPVWLGQYTAGLDHNLVCSPQFTQHLASLP